MLFWWVPYYIYRLFFRGLSYLYYFFLGGGPYYNNYGIVYPKTLFQLLLIKALALLCRGLFKGLPSIEASIITQISFWGFLV